MLNFTEYKAKRNTQSDIEKGPLIERIKWSPFHVSDLMQSINIFDRLLRKDLLWIKNLIQKFDTIISWIILNFYYVFSYFIKIFQRNIKAETEESG